MKNILFYTGGLICLAVFVLFPAAKPSFAQNSSADAPAANKQEFIKGDVVKITQEGKKPIGTQQNIFQTVEVRLLDGVDKGETITVEHGGMFTITEAQKVHAGDTVIIIKSTSPDQKTAYAISDKYRLPSLIAILFGFFLLVLCIAGRKGFGSLIGMVISIIVILTFIVPQILNGTNPLFVSVVGSIVILVSTIYLAHGFSQQTHIATAATIASLIVTAICAISFVKLAALSGLGSEDAYSLLQGFQGKINFQGLLLGSIIIGALGVLDDVTTTQSATVFALADANPKFSIKDLFNKGMSVGREHITSLVNTLVLAYAGASIAVFIYFSLGQQANVQPWWVMVNSEVIAEEVIRTLAGSIGLVLAVPLTTFLAAFFARYSLKISQ